MSALACALKEMGYNVIGSDVENYFYTEKNLKKHQIKYLVFNKENIKNADYIYISSTCYDEENEEIAEIKNKGYKLYYYYQFIDEFFGGIKIGVSGTHGKTTTTSFIADLFQDDITAIIGDGRGIGNIDYQYFIFEACEYQDHFLNYSYDYLVINNIEEDHLDYFHDLEDIKKSFQLAAGNAKYVIVREDVDIYHEQLYKFGRSDSNFTSYEILNEYPDGYLLEIKIDGKSVLIEYNHPGIHMIENLLAALTVYYLVTNSLEYIQLLVNRFNNINRRMEEYIIGENVIIDDYAHHPTEIECLLKSLKQKYSKYKLVVIFQPHTYSRTIALKDKFRICFDLADEVYITPTYTSARESFDIVKEIEVSEIFHNFNIFTEEKIKRILCGKNQVIVFLGAGIIGNFIKKIVK